MGLCKQINLLVTLGVILAFIMTVPWVSAQDCQQNPEDCDAKQVLANFTLINVVVTSDPDPPTYCEKYERISLSEDSTTTKYKVVYTAASGDNTIINDTCTFQVATNTMFHIVCTYYSNDVYLLTLDYVNENQCYVGDGNSTWNGSFQYYLFNNPDSNALEYEKCLNKIAGYSGGNIIIIHDSEKCRNIPAKPY